VAGEETVTSQVAFGNARVRRFRLTFNRPARVPATVAQ